MKKLIKVALVGNPNVGKTAIMNALAGTSEKVGNWPGVTVQKKTGCYSFRGFEVELVDLPGIYSLTSYTIEEKVTRNFLLGGDYDVVADVIDVTLLGRNLYLTLELLEMGIKPVIVLNKMDELEDYGYTIDKNVLEKLLKLPVVEISAVKKKGLDELSETFLMVATGDLKPEGFTPLYSDTLENAISLIEYFFKDVKLSYPKRWFLIKLLEKDPEVTEWAREVLGEKFTGLSKEMERIEEEVLRKFRCDLPSFVAKERFLLASRIATAAVKHVIEFPYESFSDKIDRVVTNPFTGIPIFFFVMWLVFKLTFDLSSPISDLIDNFFSSFLPGIVENYLSFLPQPLKSLINDGVLAGVGAVMVFLPVLGILYLLMSVLEDTGYMARAAALWDNFMKLFGLSGASVIPMILGFGCNVPAIYATRAMRSSVQKLVTMMIIPWMSCSARLTVFSVFTAAFFKEHQSIVMLGLYLLGVFLALGLAAVLTRFLAEGEVDEFFIELPPYKLPAWNVVLNQTFIEIREFVTKAGTVIFAVSVFIWALASLPPGSTYAGEETFVGYLGKLLLPLFAPLGIEDWKPIVALIFGALAKEVVVGTMGALYGSSEEGLGKALQSAFTPESAVAFLVFTLLYIPCVATIAAIKQESGGWRYPLLAVAIQLSVAWVMAFLVFNLLTFL